MSTTTTPSLTLVQKPVPHQSDALGSAPSLTIFTIPKSFVGHTGVIQRNAIESWKRLEPACDIVLCGDDPGVADVAAELNVQHLPDLERNELGTPYLDSAFKQVRDASDSDLLCYVNADILLLSDFRAALQHIRAERFLMVGQRCDVDIDEPIDFTEPDWESRRCAHLQLSMERCIHCGAWITLSFRASARLITCPVFWLAARDGTTG